MIDLPIDASKIASHHLATSVKTADVRNFFCWSDSELISIDPHLFGKISAQHPSYIMHLVLEQRKQ